MSLSGYLGGSSLLVTAHVDNAALSFANGVWTRVVVPGARGIAVSAGVVAVMGSDGAHIWRSDGTKGAVVLAGIIDPHEAEYVGGAVLACSPMESGLVTFDGLGIVTKVTTVPGTTPSTDGRSWINGLAVDATRARYATALGVSDVAGGWRAEAQAGRGRLIDVAANVSVLSNLFLPHSPVLVGNTVWFLNSGHGQLCRWAPGDATFTVVASVKGFSRGLVMTATHALVGVSQGRVTAFPSLTVDPLAQPGIAVIELATGLQVWFEPLDVQEVFAVKLGGPVVLG